MHISTTFYVSVKTAFLNGSGNEDTRDGGQITKVKQFQRRGESFPYVSAQAVKKWIRRTVNYLTDDFGYYERVTRSDPNKSDLEEPEGLWVDPITYIEDDLFGYSHPFLNQPEQDNKKHLKVTVANRLSPYQTTALVSLPKTSTISEYDGWVNPGQNTSLPFNTEMMSGLFECGATLDLNRIGVYRKYGDTVELDPFYIDYYLDEGKLVETSSNQFSEYRLVNLKDRRKRAIELYFDSILNLYGAAKSTLLATDLSPRILITTQLKSANNLFYQVVKAGSDNRPYFDRNLLLQRLENRSMTLLTDVYIGYRSGTLPKQQEEHLLELDGKKITGTEYSIHVVSPGEAATELVKSAEVIS